MSAVAAPLAHPVRPAPAGPRSNRGDARRLRLDPSRHGRTSHHARLAYVVENGDRARPSCFCTVTLAARCGASSCATVPARSGHRRDLRGTASTAARGVRPAGLAATRRCSSPRRARRHRRRPPMVADVVQSAPTPEGARAGPGVVFLPPPRRAAAVAVSGRSHRRTGAARGLDSMCRSAASATRRRLRARPTGPPPPPPRSPPVRRPTSSSPANLVNAASRHAFPVGLASVTTTPEERWRDRRRPVLAAGLDRITPVAFSRRMAELLPRRRSPRLATPAHHSTRRPDISPPCLDRSPAPRRLLPSWRIVSSARRERQLAVCVVWA